MHRVRVGTNGETWPAKIRRADKILLQMGVDLPRSRLGQQQVSVVCSGHISSPAEGGKHQPVPAVYVMFHSV